MTIDQESAQLGYGPAKHDPQGLLMSQLARDTLAIVLAGGRGSRLGPLTDWRAKPAVPFGIATEYGVMALDHEFRIVDFDEKPAKPKPAPGRQDIALASMGIYVFNASFLYEQLIRDADDSGSSSDFGRDVIPYLIGNGHRVFAHRFADSCVNMVEGRPYWRDVGTIDAYWEATLDLTHVTPDLNLYDEHWPIWSYQEQLPPAKFVFEATDRTGAAFDSLVSGGCIVSGSSIRRSLLFSNVHVHSYCNIEDSVVLADFAGHRNAVLRKCVVDRYCTLPAGFEAGVDPAQDRKRFFVTDRGVTLITPEMLGQDMHHLR